jgi:hypothetical protein
MLISGSGCSAMGMTSFSKSEAAILAGAEGGGAALELVAGVTEAGLEVVVEVTADDELCVVTRAGAGCAGTGVAVGFGSCSSGGLAQERPKRKGRRAKNRNFIS